MKLTAKLTTTVVVIIVSAVSWAGDLPDPGMTVAAGLTAMSGHAAEDFFRLNHQRGQNYGVPEILSTPHTKP